jgi:hypothetical protein
MSGHNALNVVDLLPGTCLRTNEGAIVELIENPRDGVWLICKFLQHDAEPDMVSDVEQPVFAQDIVGFADQ